ncbi:MAG: phytanoyl-CoA dioxygenase family protein [Acidimicrobiales bacterium]
MTAFADTTSATLSPEQLADYQRDGYLILKGRIPETDIQRFEAALDRNPPLDATLDPNAGNFPEPGRYTLAMNCLKDPDLAYLAEHPGIVPTVADVLGGEPRLTAFVIYNRTPGGNGLPSHNDYKRWRPVGSSMNWAFTIVPFCDFTSEAGRLFIAPGSHHLHRVAEGPERPLCVAPPIQPDESDFIDPELERGDLLIMNMHLWHRAEGNNSSHDRIGAFNKYASVDAPPATGYFMFDDDVHEALSPEGRKLLAVHSDKPVGTTRLLLMRERGEADPEFYLTAETGDTPSGAALKLPGGDTFVERAIPDWDRGNYIASLAAALREQLRIELPWVSYVGDFDEGDHLCRVYAYTLPGLGFPVAYADGRWMTRDQAAADKDLAFGYEVEAIDRWLDPTIVRGKGLTQAQCRVNQYAY